MPATPNPPLIDSIMELGIPAWPHVLIFFALIIFSGVVYTKNLDSRYRYSTLPLAFVPFFIGISGFLYTFSNAVNQQARWSNFYELRSPAIDFHTYSIIPIMASTETAILLLISAVLLITNRDASDKANKS